MRRPLIIPIFIPHGGCPHQCLFCNQHLISSTVDPLPDPDTLQGRVQAFLDHSRHHQRPIQLAFFGGNFLGLASNIREALMEAAQQLVKENQIAGIRFSTRPETITPQAIQWLSGFSVAAVELGAQSMNGQILKNARRGHTPQETVRATELLRSLPKIQVGHQLMLGLPGDTAETAMASGHRVVESAPDFVRLYPTLVLKSSPLATQFEKGLYKPWNLAQTVTVAKHLFRLFGRNGIAVIRMGLQPGEDLVLGQTILAGPYHPAFGELVQSALWLDAISDLLSGLKKPDHTWTGRLHHHPRDESAIIGQQRRNLHSLAQDFPELTLALKVDGNLERNRFCFSWHRDGKRHRLSGHRDGLHLQ